MISPEEHERLKTIGERCLESVLTEGFPGSKQDLFLAVFGQLCLRVRALEDAKGQQYDDPHYRMGM